MVPRCYDQIERAIRDEPKLKGGFSTVGPTLLFTKNALSLGKNEPTQDISKDNLGNFETDQFREVNAAGTSTTWSSSAAPAGSWRFSQSAGADEGHSRVGFHDSRTLCI